MAEPRDPLQIRVDDEEHDGDRPEPAHERVELVDGDEVERERAAAESEHLRHASGGPHGSSRPAVRGLRASTPASISRLSAIASVRAPTIATVIQSRSRARGAPPDGEQRADVGERQREDGVLELDEPREAGAASAGRAGAHVCRCVGRARRRAARARARAPGCSTAKPSRQPPGEPGRLTTSVLPRDARDAAREQRVRRPRQRVGADRLGDAGRLAVDHGAGRLGRHVARREPRAARREHELRALPASSPIAAGDRRSARRQRRVARPRSPLRRAAPRARRRSGPRASPSCTPSETVSTAAFTQLPSSSRRERRR